MESKTLYELSAEMTEIMENGFCQACVDEEGEIIDAKVKEYFDSIKISADTKIDYIATTIKNEIALAEAIKEEKLNLELRQKRLNKKADYWKGYLTECLTNLNKDKFDTVRNSISFIKSVKVNVLDESKLTSDFLKIETKPDLTKIKAAIKLGEIVDGAELLTCKNIQIK